MVIVCAGKVKLALLLRLVPRPASLAWNGMGMLNHVVGQSLDVSQNAIVTYGTRVGGVDMLLERGCRGTDKVANNTFCPRRMLRSPVGL